METLRLGGVDEFAIEYQMSESFDEVTSNSKTFHPSPTCVIQVSDIKNRYKSMSQ
jgi:hypothetical protein